MKLGELVNRAKQELPDTWEDFEIEIRFHRGNSDIITNLLDVAFNIKSKIKTLVLKDLSL